MAAWNFPLPLCVCVCVCVMHSVCTDSKRMTIIKRITAMKVVLIEAIERVIRKMMTCVPSLCSLVSSGTLMWRWREGREDDGGWLWQYKNSTPSVLEHIFMSFGCDLTILLTLEWVCGSQKINSESLYYFYPHMSFWSSIKSTNNKQNRYENASQYWRG